MPTAERGRTALPCLVLFLVSIIVLSGLEFLATGVLSACNPDIPESGAKRKGKGREFYPVGARASERSWMIETETCATWMWFKSGRRRSLTGGNKRRRPLVDASTLLASINPFHARARNSNLGSWHRTLTLMLMVIIES